MLSFGLVQAKIQCSQFMQPTEMNAARLSTEMMFLSQAPQPLPKKGIPCRAFQSWI